MLPSIRNTCLAAGILLASIADAGARPPTLDPTYGLPLPRHAPPASRILAADWIWANNAGNNQTIFLRRDFDLKSVPNSAVLFITADNAFTVYINGKQVDSSADQINTPNNWQNVHRVETAPDLTAGRNTICVRGFNSDGPAGVVAHLILPGGRDVETDGRWRVSTDAAEPNGWTEPSFDDSGWAAATVEAPVQGGAWLGGGGLPGWPGYDVTAPYLVHLTVPVARVLDVHPGSGKITGASTLSSGTGVLTVRTPSNAADPASLVVDFGREVAGRVTVKAVTAGAVLVGTGESYQEATQSPWGGQHALSFAAGDSATTPYSAFRFAKLVFPPGDSSAKTVKVRIALDDKYYPVQYKGSFDCSDPLLTRLWYMGAYTCHLCMQENIWDAPKRDRQPWIGDLHVSGEVINNVFADRFLMESTIDLLRPGNTADDVNGIPGYSAAYICTMADFYRHIGDSGYLKRHHEELLGLLRYIRESFDDHDLFANKHNHWVFTDWSPGLDNSSPVSDACTDLFTIRAAEDGAYLLSEMGDRDNAASFRQWGEQLKKAAQNNYFAHGAFGDCLQENAMAVYSGTAAPDQYATIFNSVLTPGSNSWNKADNPPYNKGQITPYYGNYVLSAMSMTGHTREAEKLMRTYWGGMVAEGATTFWEVYDPHWPKKDYHTHLCAGGKFGTFVSLCHGWSAGPTTELTEYVLGVRPTGAGYKTVIIDPDLGDLSWASGTVPTPRGPIDLTVRKSASGLRLKVTLPAGTRATVIQDGKAIKMGSKSEKSRLELSQAGTFELSVQ